MFIRTDETDSPALRVRVTMSIFDYTARSRPVSGDPAAADAWRGFMTAASRLSDLDDEADPFARFVASWPHRSAVKRPEPDFSQVFDASRPDFLVDLLPFRDHQDFVGAPEHLRQAVLSCGWLAYNARTIAVEARVVSPACMHVVDDVLPGIPSRRYREAIAEALVDESYHILLTSNACDVTRIHRELDHVRLPPFDLVQLLQAEQDAHPEPWKKILVQVAAAVVSEMLVSDYLKLLSETDEVQPFNVLTTAIHRKDESAHNGLFKTLGTELYQLLAPHEQEFFRHILVKPARWFASAELSVWQSMLEQIEFPNAARMIADCRDQGQLVQPSLDLSSLQRLYNELELTAPDSVLD
ncbi:MAG: diiron oxygenase [Fuerstiella sp.]